MNLQLFFNSWNNCSFFYSSHFVSRIFLLYFFSLICCKLSFAMQRASITSFGCSLRREKHFAFRTSPECLHRARPAGVRASHIKVSCLWVTFWGFIELRSSPQHMLIVKLTFQIIHCVQANILFNFKLNFFIFRFMPPGSAPAWPGIKCADMMGPVCPQKLPDVQQLDPTRKDHFTRLLKHLENQSEDCLYLNIYVPMQGRCKTS